MSDHDLIRAAERAVAADPNDTRIAHILSRLRVRHGLGWEGQVRRCDERGAVVAVRDGEQPAGYEWRTHDGALTIPLVWVPAGPFLMGSREGDGKAWADEKPQHKRTLQGYWIGREPVSVAQWRTFCAATGRAVPEQPAWSTDVHPVVNVSWDDATAFAAWAGLELPTEAEWEKAARGTDGRTYPWGEEPPAKRAWEAGPEVPYPADRASPCGALGMSGAVWQWCADAWDPEAYKRQGEAHPTAAARHGSIGAGAGTTRRGTAARRTASGACPASGAATSASALSGGREGQGEDRSFLRVLRGGSCGSDASGCRVTVRFSVRALRSGGNFGFRIARRP